MLSHHVAERSRSPYVYRSFSFAPYSRFSFQKTTCQSLCLQVYRSLTFFGRLPGSSSNRWHWHAHWPHSYHYPAHVSSLAPYLFAGSLGTRSDALASTTIRDSTKFVFFKGVNDAGDGQGTVQVAVTGGLPAGFYTIGSLGSAANHQPPLPSIAQRGVGYVCSQRLIAC
jgi:hypothetical protein